MLLVFFNLPSSFLLLTLKLESECWIWYFPTLDEDNWKGKNPPKKAVPTSRRANHSMLNTTVEVCKSIMLLKNGHLSVGSTSIQTVYTCSFDSVYYIIAAMYADFKEISDQIDQLAKESDFARMVFTMFKSNTRPAIKQNVLLKEKKNFRWFFSDDNDSKRLSFYQLFR